MRPEEVFGTEVVSSRLREDSKAAATLRRHHPLADGHEMCFARRQVTCSVVCCLCKMQHYNGMVYNGMSSQTLQRVTIILNKLSTIKIYKLCRTEMVNQK